MKSEDKETKQKGSTMYCTTWNTILKYIKKYYYFLLYCINIYEGGGSSYGLNCLKFIGFSDSNKVKEVTTIYINHEFAPACLHKEFWIEFSAAPTPGNWWNCDSAWFSLLRSKPTSKDGSSFSPPTSSCLHEYCLWSDSWEQRLNY